MLKKNLKQAFELLERVEILEKRKSLIAKATKVRVTCIADSGMQRDREVKWDSMVTAVRNSVVQDMAFEIATLNDEIERLMNETDRSAAPELPNDYCS